MASEGQPVLLLGAGHGRRLGGPKVFAQTGGCTFLARILARCCETRSPVTLTVDRAFRRQVEALLAELASQEGLPPPRLVDAAGDKPMLASVREALRLGGYEPGFWLWPVDAPFISAAGWRRAVATVAADPNVVWKLRSGGRSGHPVWFPFYTIPAIRRGTWPDGLRGFLATVEPERIHALELPGEWLGDVDTPEELVAVEAHLRGEPKHGGGGT